MTELELSRARLAVRAGFAASLRRAGYAVHRARRMFQDTMKLPLEQDISIVSDSPAHGTITVEWCDERRIVHRAVVSRIVWDRYNRKRAARQSVGQQ